eukprot:2149100-Alexandrium_andersonii.AAC.1
MKPGLSPSVDQASADALNRADTWVCTSMCARHHADTRTLECLRLGTDARMNESASAISFPL